MLGRRGGRAGSGYAKARSHAEAVAAGAMGGAAGTGRAKRRGNSDFYKVLAARRGGKNR